MEMKAELAVKLISNLLNHTFIILKYMKDVIYINQQVIGLHFHLQKQFDQINIWQIFFF